MGFQDDLSTISWSLNSVKVLACHQHIVFMSFQIVQLKVFDGQVHGDALVIAKDRDTDLKMKSVYSGLSFG